MQEEQTVGWYWLAQVLVLDAGGGEGGGQGGGVAGVEGGIQV